MPIRRLSTIGHLVILGVSWSFVRGEGIWIGPEEIDQRPNYGPAWEAVLQAANRSTYGEPNLADQDSGHDTKVLAAAMAYARTGNELHRARAITELMAIVGTENNVDPNCTKTSRPPEFGEGPPGARSMAIGRSLAAYCIAADLLDFRSGGHDPDGQGARWEAWVDGVRFRVNCPNNGNLWRNLSEVHDEAGSNGNAMAGGARIACAAYLGDDDEVAAAWDTFRRFCGNLEVGPDLRVNYPSWQHDPEQPVAINPAGTAKDGHRIDGVIVNDQGRGGEFQWPPAYTSYPWDSILGLAVQATVLERSGYPAWSQGDSAIRRAVEFLYHLRQETGEVRWADGNRASPAIWLVNAAYGTSFRVGAAGEDKNIAWADWTHGAPGPGVTERPLPPHHLTAD
jgi:hypothetical protein